MRPLDDVVDHRRQAHPQPVVRVVHAFDAVRLQLADLLGRDRASAAAEHQHVPGALLRQTIDHVAEELHVAALVRADRDCIRVLLHRCPHDLVDAAVVTEVDDLRPPILDHPPHDVDRRVVTVEQ